MTAAPVHLATRNGEVLLTTLARARGHDLVRRPGFVALNGPALLRALVLAPDPDADDLAALARLVADAPGRVTVEDPFGTVDAAPWRLAPSRLPMMVRPPSPLPAPALDVTTATTAEELSAVERTVLDGFPLRGLRPGEAFPPALLDETALRFHLVRRAGVVAGACLTVEGDSAAGLYWVTTLPEHRSRGIGRALAHAALNGVDKPMTLTATDAGAPLYASLGFETASFATWWFGNR
ncbi:GNAT family N-acetyltransferase [Saccharothrix australiensis]|uniref:Acetyltransferase (GNAT) family protein n=1 Tax=Saccharothrix australiensis TaxID=2072 RepID=A0A495W425_9PSEU|nr:GNAT family N-acetyltransferase [Saccharothrix australiensis]RKT55850.1 acetyltransferase (GNAT) family protein [Saccharothrix australiensis]